MINDKQSEKAVITAILSDKENVFRAIEVLKDGDFTDTTCRKIFVNALLDPENFGLLSLPSELRKEARNIINEGVDYLGQLDKAISNIKEASYKNQVSDIAQNIINSCKEQNDPKSLIADLMQVTDKTGNDLTDPKHAGENYLTSINERFDCQKLELPFRTIQSTTGGFMPGEMWIIAARPSVGKTALLENVAHYLASKNKNVLFVSAEMTTNALMDRFISRQTTIPTSELRRGVVKDSPAYLKIMKETENFKINVLDGSSDVASIYAKAKRLKLQNKLDIIFVDYLQRLEGKGESEYQRVTRISNGLKNLALELKVPIVVAAQYNRQADNGQPKLADLRDSGNIEQDADVVLSLWLEKQVSEGNDKQITNCDILKNRQGSTFNGGYQLMFKKSETKFYELEKNIPQDIPELVNYSYKED